MAKLSQLDFVFKGQSQSEHAFVIMHGYGASMHDLAPIGEWMEQTVGGAWYFLQAPLEVALGPYMSGRAWFEIDMMKLQMASMRGEFASIFENEVPSGLEDSGEKIVEAIEVIRARHSRLHIGGFSQGSMMAARTALMQPSWFETLTIFSGVFVTRKIWEETTRGELSFKTFQSHGRQDPVLPFNEALKLRDFFNEHRHDHQFVEFVGGHEIPLPVLQQWQSFLQKAMA